MHATIADGIELVKQTNEVNMTKTISASQAKARLSSLLAQVEHGHEQFIIERHGRPVAVLARPEDVQQADDNAEAEPGPRGLLAFAGAWKELSEEEADAMIEEIYRLRRTDRAREVNLED